MTFTPALVALNLQGNTPLDAAEGSSRDVIMMLGGKDDAHAETQRFSGVVAGAQYVIRVVALWLPWRLW